MSDLADLIRETVPDWSNRRIAKTADVAPGTVDGIMRGDRTPAVDTLDKIAHALKLPVERVREAAGQPRGEAAPYTPPSEANLLDDRQRRAIDELIRSFIETRGAPDVDQSATAPAAPEGTPNTPSEDVKKIPVAILAIAPTERAVYWETVYAESTSEVTEIWERNLTLAGLHTERQRRVPPYRVALAADRHDGPLYFEFADSSNELDVQRAEKKLYAILDGDEQASRLDASHRKTQDLRAVQDPFDDPNPEGAEWPDGKVVTREETSGYLQWLAARRPEGFEEYRDGRRSDYGLAARETGERKGADPRGLDDGEE